MKYKENSEENRDNNIDKGLKHSCIWSSLSQLPRVDLGFELGGGGSFYVKSFIVVTLTSN